jgi:hypothetical protein
MTEHLQLLTAEEAAGMLRLATKTVHKLCREGKLSHVWIADKRCFLVKHLAEYINRQTVPSREPKKIDTPKAEHLPFAQKGGDRSRAEAEELAQLSKEMRQWQ